MIFTNKADKNLASLVKAVDGVQKNNKSLGTVVVGISGVQKADLEKLQEKHRLTTPLTIAVSKNGPRAYKINPKAAVTVILYGRGGVKTQTFGFTDTASAAAKSKQIAAAAAKAVSK